MLAVVEFNSISSGPAGSFVQKEKKVLFRLRGAWNQHGSQLDSSFCVLIAV
jgi:hypothetical protein